MVFTKNTLLTFFKSLHNQVISIGIIMFNNFKFILFALVAVVLVNMFLTGGGTSESTAQLDRVLGVASATAGDFESTPDVNEDNAMDKFAIKFNDDLNAAQPPIHPTTLGTRARENGSLLSFDDLNANGKQDPGEDSLFMTEVDAENNKLIATNQEESRNSGFSGSGLLMGYMIGSMLSRQRATGTNPAARKTTAKGTRSARGARSRSRSGSHSRGK